MNYLGIDYGEKRIGLSFADELGIAIPIPAAIGRTLKDRLERIKEVVKTRNVDAIVIGYPYNMDGSIGFKIKEVDLFIEELKKIFNLPIYTIDERLTSHQVETDMSSMRLSRKKESIKSKQKARKTGDIDSRSAALLLQDFLETKQGK